MELKLSLYLCCYLMFKERKFQCAFLRLRGWSGEASILYIKLSSLYKIVFHSIHFLLISVTHSSVLLKVLRKLVENGLIWITVDCCALLVL